MNLTLNIIGAGRVGQTLGHLLFKKQQVKIGSVCNTSMVSARDAAHFIGEGKACVAMEALLPADIILITTPDALIESAAQALSETFFLKKDSIVLHCSGCFSSDILYALKAKGAWVASVHPMHSFVNPACSIVHYPGTYCAMEGDPEAVSLLESLFKSIGSITYEISKDKKTLYHAAGVFASNYLVTLAQQAWVCLKEAGVGETMVMDVVRTLMHGTLSNLDKTSSPSESLTGPILRGEEQVLKKHMESFPNQQLQTLYAILGKATLDLTSHETHKRAFLHQLLSVSI